MSCLLILLREGGRIAGGMKFGSGGKTVYMFLVSDQIIIALNFVILEICSDFSATPKQIKICNCSIALSLFTTE